MNRDKRHLGNAIIGSTNEAENVCSYNIFFYFNAISMQVCITNYAIKYEGIYKDRRTHQNIMHWMFGFIDIRGSVLLSLLRRVMKNATFSHRFEQYPKQNNILLKYLYAMSKIKSENCRRI